METFKDVTGKTHDFKPYTGKHKKTTWAGYHITHYLHRIPTSYNENTGFHTHTNIYILEHPTKETHTLYIHCSNMNANDQFKAVDERIMEFLIENGDYEPEEPVVLITLPEWFINKNPSQFLLPAVKGGAIGMIMRETEKAYQVAPVTERGANEYKDTWVWLPKSQTTITPTTWATRTIDSINALLTDEMLEPYTSAFFELYKRRYSPERYFDLTPEEYDEYITESINVDLHGIAHNVTYYLNNTLHYHYTNSRVPLDDMDAICLDRILEIITQEA